MQSPESEYQNWKWVDVKWKPGSSLSVVVEYWIGWCGVMLGSYTSGSSLIEFIKTASNVSAFILVFSAGTIFFFAGFLSISMSRNRINHARQVDITGTSCRVLFWWRGRRKDLEFNVSDLESIEPCPKEKGIIDLLSQLPREPVCYQVKVRGQPGFRITGSSDDIHEVAKRLSEIRLSAAPRRVTT